MSKEIVRTLEYAVEKNFNVLMRGKHGVGKTALVRKCFGAKYGKWLYFSASTMDPWVDLIGVPKERTDPQTNITYLELVRPYDFAFDEVEAIMFDELNRAPKKVRNAVMELIQFGSINGKKFTKLKVIWAAINPEDDEGTYDVEKLDPAQIDRFHLHIDVPYKVDAEFFVETFGQQGARACKWWNDLEDKVKELVSPRRLEYALQVLNTGGDPHYVLNSKCNVSAFINTLSKGDPLEICNQLIQKSPIDIQRYLLDNNNFNHVKSTMMNEERLLRALTPHLSPEILLKELVAKTNSPNQKLITFVSQNTETFDNLMESILSQRTVYSEALTRSFDSHKKRVEKVQREALTTSQAVMEKLQNAATENIADKMVTINGRQIRAGDLTIHNFENLTGGRRIRINAAQEDRMAKGLITPEQAREEALREYLKRIIQTNEPV